VRFGLLIAVNVKNAVFWDVPLPGLLLIMKVSHSCILKVEGADPSRTSVRLHCVNSPECRSVCGRIQVLVFRGLGSSEMLRGEIGSWLPTFRNISVPLSWPLKMGPECCPETLVTDYEHTLRIIPSGDLKYPAAEACNLVRLRVCWFVLLKHLATEVVLCSHVFKYGAWIWTFHLVKFVPNFSP
jgi:hypothetical protein